MKLQEENWYGLDHKAVGEHMEGEFTYKNNFFIEKLQEVGAVYYNTKPNREKDHKDYLIIFGKYDPVTENSKLFVTGLDTEDMKKERYQDGVYCSCCEDVIYSMYRHDYRECSCKKCFIDGGKDYTKTGTEGQVVKIDLLERTVKF